MNQNDRPLIPTYLPTQLSVFKIADLVDALFGGRQTPFAGSGIPQTWKYKGVKYDKSEVNYILMGHGMKHEKVAYYLGMSLATIWKEVRYHHGLSSGTLYWFTKGYFEYDERADW